MASVALTDDQLIEKLKAYGEVVNVKLPLKQVKRDVLMKKLNHIRIKNKNDQTLQSQNKSFSSFSAFSSDESDTGKDNVQTTTRRRTTTRNKDKGQSSQQATQKIYGEPTRKSSIRTRSKDYNSISSDTRVEKKKSLENTTTKSSDTTQINENWLNLFSFGFSKKPKVLKPASTNQPQNLTESKLYHSYDLDSSDSDVDLNSTYEVENRGVNTTFTIDTSQDIKFGSSFNNRSVNHSYNNSSPVLTSARFSTSTPSQKPEKKQINSALIEQYQIDRSASERVKSRLKGSAACKDTPRTSRVLLLLATLFFIILACGYLYIRQPLGAQGSTAPRESNPLMCLNKEECSEVYRRELVKKAHKIIVQHLFDELSTRKGHMTCGYQDTGNMTTTELLHFIHHKDVVVNDSAQTLRRAILDLLIHNEHWQLRVLKADYSKANSPNETKYIESLVARQDFLCRVRLAVFRLIGHALLWLCIAVLATSLAWLMLYLFRRRRNQWEDEQKRVYNMVENIIDILKTNSEIEGREPYLAIQHIRDVLIPPADRQIMNATWDKAVKFIEQHESRVRLETQTIQKEDFAVWRWLQNFPSSGKVWQGQACGLKDLTFNALAYSPTQCLKIRNMFDTKLEEEESSEWILRVQDAILEKASGCNILHLYVDHTSHEGCVYVKCLSPEEAGKVYRCLHGWWFDGKLVTVKYLRLEHYHDRFPESRHAVHPLSPSTSDMNSLSQPYYTSPLEIT